MNLIEMVYRHLSMGCIGNFYFCTVFDACRITAYQFCIDYLGLAVKMKMNKKAGSFRQNIRQAFAAFSYEHSGEMLSSKGKSKVLSGTSKNYSVKERD